MKFTRLEVLSYDQPYYGSRDFRVEATAYVNNEEFEGWVEFDFSWDMCHRTHSELSISFTDIEDETADVYLEDVQEALEDYISKGKFQELNDLVPEEDEE